MVIDSLWGISSMHKSKCSTGIILLLIILLIRSCLNQTYWYMLKGEWENDFLHLNLYGTPCHPYPDGTIVLNNTEYEFTAAMQKMHFSFCYKVDEGESLREIWSGTIDIDGDDLKVNVEYDDISFFSGCTVVLHKVVEENTESDEKGPDHQLAV